MQVSVTPERVQDLDLMKRLDAYAQGRATYAPEGAPLDSSVKQACRELHTHLTALVQRVLGFVLDRSTAREMDMFTMHDHTHGQKVAHLMWHILTKERQERLTPPEIGMLVAAAFIHDTGMSLTREEREARLNPESDLWDRIESQDAQKAAMQSLHDQVADPNLSQAERTRARRRLEQAEEALLTHDTRDRHATPERYKEVLSLLEQFSQNDPVAIPNIRAVLAFEGDSFLDKLLDICVSHNQDAITLVENDLGGSGRARFPRDYPLGSSQADLQMIAAALRLADILDFDRERTPPVLFYYLLPTNIEPDQHRSVMAWSKHLSISHWYIEHDAVVFRGHCNHHVVHHAIVQFCEEIRGEIARTRATFGNLGNADWPFILPALVKADIFEHGYKYVPYHFELDDHRVYELLMGGAIYDNPLVAVRELVQNAVDACKLRDALMRREEPGLQPDILDRIIVRYEEPTGDCPHPRLTMRDKGTGMDALILENYFLQVGRSYYNSPEFNTTRVELRKNNVDFAPVSEFGIGFLSCFLLADEVVVDTAPFQPMHKEDTRRRRLFINGPTRLIRMEEPENSKERFKGTAVTLYLTRGSSEGKVNAPAWAEICSYLKEICQDLPYRLTLEYSSLSNLLSTEYIEAQGPEPPKLYIPTELEPYIFRIPVNDKAAGLEGEIVVRDLEKLEDRTQRRVTEQTTAEIDTLDLIIVSTEEAHYEADPLVNEIYQLEYSSALLRGGFKIGNVRGTPRQGHGRGRGFSPARLRLTWEGRANKRYLSPNLARSSISAMNKIEQDVVSQWFWYLMNNVNNLPDRLVYNLYNGGNDQLPLQGISASDLYRVAVQGWKTELSIDAITPKIQQWEEGIIQSLPYHSNSRFPSTRVFHYLLDLILPRVCELQIERQKFINHEGEERYRLGYKVKSPSHGWQEVLQSLREYRNIDLGWQVAEYIGDIADVLYYYDSNHNGPDCVNSKYQDRFSEFSKDELNHCTGVMETLLHALRYKRPITVSPEQFQLLGRLRQVAGDLEIGYEDQTWRIDTLKL